MYKRMHTRLMKSFCDIGTKGFNYYIYYRIMEALLEK